MEQERVKLSEPKIEGPTPKVGADLHHVGIDNNSILIGVLILIVIIIILYMIKVISENRDLKEKAYILSSQYRKANVEKAQLARQLEPSEFMDQMKRDKQRDSARNKANGIKDPVQERLKKDELMRTRGKNQAKPRPAEEENDQDEEVPDEELNDIVDEIQGFDVDTDE